MVTPARRHAIILPSPPDALRHMSAKWLSGLLLLAGCATQTPPATQVATPDAEPTLEACVESGIASWYRGASRGRTTPDEFVAAHKTLPFGTGVQVTALETGRSVIVRINDRGPFGKGRVIDLSKSAAEELGIRRDGVAQVRLATDHEVGRPCPIEEARFAGGDRSR
jgi:rare lipoprotein A